MRTITTPGTIARVFMKTNHKLVSDGYSTWNQEIRTVCPAVQAQLVTSMMRHRKGYHAPILDLDIPHELISSSTPGHSHLYLDVEVPWWKYKVLLRVLAWVGILEKNYVKVSILRGHTDVRVPWLKKGDEE